MGARLLIGTRWFGRKPEDQLAAFRVAYASQAQGLMMLSAQLAELQAGMNALRSVTGAIVVALGGEARVHQADIAMAIQIMAQSGGLIVKDELGGVVSVRAGERSRIVVPGARMPRG